MWFCSFFFFLVPALTSSDAESYSGNEVIVGLGTRLHLFGAKLPANSVPTYRELDTTKHILLRLECFVCSIRGITGPV